MRHGVKGTVTWAGDWESDTPRARHLGWGTYLGWDEAPKAEVTWVEH